MATGLPLEPVQEAELHRELSDGEKLLWMGRPPTGLRLSPADLFQIPFSVLWAGFACFWEWSVFHSGAPFFFILWGVPFLLMGAYIVVGRFFHDALRRQKIVYGLTGERAILIEGIYSRQVRSLLLTQLGQIHCAQRADGSGTINFGPASAVTTMFAAGWPGASKRLPPQFDGIADVRRVYRLIVDLQRNQAVADSGCLRDAGRADPELDVDPGWDEAPPRR